MKKLENGFYTALGTPIDENANLVEESLVEQINQQIKYGAAGLLLMGSMGMEEAITHSTYGKVVEVAAKAVDGRCPLFVGAMDTSIAKVMDKIAMIGDAKIDGVVLTTPFYSVLTDDEVVNFFTTIANKSPFPIYLYDLAVITKYKITLKVIDRLINHPNIKGMKTADWELIKAIERNYPDAEFDCLYSGLNTFDYANVMGIGKNLDGMCSCTPKNCQKMVECFKNKDFVGGRKYLDNVLLLRDTFKEHDLMCAYTYSMNLLGCSGNFHQDYTMPITEEAKAAVEKVMKQIGEI